MNVFNDKDFSDRILHIEIISDSDMDPKRINHSNKKQKREDLGKKGDVASDNNLKCSTDVKVKTLHISSAMLGAKSSFFFKLFKNGMRESQENVVTLKIKASEEEALMDVLKFMYTNTLTAASVPKLVGVLVMADKFEVSSCMDCCCKLLNKKPMSLDSALLYLELPSSLLECALLQSLLDAAKKCVFNRYKKVTVPFISQEEAASLPLLGIEVLLGSDDLEVKSEDDLYDFILIWGRARYPNQEERQDILTKLLGRFLYFPYMFMSWLEQIQECPDFDSKEVSKLMLNSLYLNAGFPYGQQYHVPVPTSLSQSLKRKYEELPIKQVELESHCVVYLNLLTEKCWDIMETRVGQCSQPFLLGEYWFALCVEAVVGEETEEDGDEEESFGLFVEMMQDEGDGPCMFDYEFAVMKGSSKDFECCHKADNCTLTGGQRLGSEKLFQVPYCENYNGDDYEYKDLVDGVVRVRAKFTVNHS